MVKNANFNTFDLNFLEPDVLSQFRNRIRFQFNKNPSENILFIQIQKTVHFYV